MLDDLLNLTKGMANDFGNLDTRRVAVTPVGDNGAVVSTVFTSDMGFETALCNSVRPHGDEVVHPVERYGMNATRERAQRGHDEWVKEAKLGNKYVDLGYGSSVDPFNFTFT
jgi:hypothetical protein